MTRRIRVLLVDDAATVRRLVAEAIADDPALEVAGTAAHGQMGLERIEELHPDVVLLDLEMPVMNGLDCLRRLRADSATENLPVMMVTTESEMAQVALALDAGANEYLMKPFDRQALLEKLLLIGLDPGRQAA